MNSGDIVKNFELVEQINTLDDFVFELDNKPSIFWRFKVMPTSFFQSWHLREIRTNIERGLFWKVKRINNN
jgi:hypothetical protein